MPQRREMWARALRGIRALNFYKRYPADYANDTRHLNLSEHGAYTLLLDYYYTNERPLPPNEAEICRLMCARTASDRAAIHNIISQFFSPTPQGFTHRRCVVEIKKYKHKIKALSVNGRKGGISRQAKAKQLPDFNGSKSGVEPEPEPEPEPDGGPVDRGHTPIKSKSKAAGKSFGASSPRTELEQRRIVEARDARIEKERELVTELNIGAGPVGGHLKPEALKRIREREKRQIN